MTKTVSALFAVAGFLATVPAIAADMRAEEAQLSRPEPVLVHLL